MATKQQQVIPVIDFDTSIFAAHYQQGLRRFLFEQQERAGPLSDENVVATFKNFTYTGLFDRQQEQSLRQAVGGYLGTIHAGVLSVLTGQLRPDVTTLVAICNQDAARSYRVGREWFFVDAEPYERRYTESRLMERLRESVLEMVHWQDCDSTWFFSIGCLLGELSGQLFPINDQEQKDYIQQYPWLGE
jgi:hypothetical protein